MKATFRTQQQIESFWNLIQLSDESIQKELYVLLDNKYGKEHERKKENSFLNLKGVLKTKGSQKTDKKILDEYLEEKYKL